MTRLEAISMETWRINRSGMVQITTTARTWVTSTVQNSSALMLRVLSKRS